jgi:hypothetical protein
VRAQILVLDTNRELRWADFRGELISNFFRGSHWWTLEPLPDGTTRLIHGAKVMGLALPFLQNSTMKARAWAAGDAVRTREHKHTHTHTHIYTHTHV